MRVRAARVLREESRDAEGRRRREVDDEEFAYDHRAPRKGNGHANCRTGRRARVGSEVIRASTGFSEGRAGRGLVRGAGAVESFLAKSAVSVAASHSAN